MPLLFHPLFPPPGFPVMGIWPPESDGTDVNSADRSAAGRHLVTSDDLGLVKVGGGRGGEGVIGQGGGVLSIIGT